MTDIFDFDEKPFSGVNNKEHGYLKYELLITSIRKARNELAEDKKNEFIELISNYLHELIVDVSTNKPNIHDQFKTNDLRIPILNEILNDLVS